MSRLNMLKKLANLPDDPAPLTSPHFKGTPTVPNVGLPDSTGKIANTKFVATKIADATKVYTTRISDIENKMSVYDKIDIDQITEDIKNEVIGDLSSDMLNKITNTTIKVSYDDISLKQAGTLKIVDDLLNALGELSGVQSVTMEPYKVELTNRRAQLVTYYDAAYSSYQKCLEGSEQYSTFNTKFTTWYNYMTDVDKYCQYVVRKLNGYLIGLKADATQEAIFNALTNNGKAQGIFLAEDENGVKQLYINAQFVQMKGVKVLDVNNNVTFAIGADGSVTINATNFTVKGRTVNSLVADAMSDSTVIQDSVNNATSSIVSQINDLDNKVNDLKASVDKINNVVKDAIKDGIITEAEQKSLVTLYADLDSRNTAALQEIDIVLNLKNIKDNDKSILTSYRAALVSAFKDVTSAYNATQQTNPTTSSFTDFKDFVKKWNSNLGLTLSYCKTSMANIAEVSGQLTYTREQIFNILTKNGQNQGLFMNEGKLYINGEYVKSADFKATNAVHTNNLYATNIYSDSVVSQLTEDITLYVNSSSGNDKAIFRNGAVFKTIQPVIDAIPNALLKTATIIIQTDVIGSMHIDNKHGGKIKVLCNGHTIFGTIRVAHCSTVVEVYGQTDNGSSVDASNRAVISPINLQEVDEDTQIKATIYADGSTLLYLRDLAIYGKIANNDRIFENLALNFIVASINNSMVKVVSCSCINSDNGFYAYGSQLITEDTSGRANVHGYYGHYGAKIGICRYTATSGKVGNLMPSGDSGIYELIRIDTSTVEFDGKIISPNQSLLKTSGYEEVTERHLSLNGQSFRTVLKSDADQIGAEVGGTDLYAYFDNRVIQGYHSNDKKYGNYQGLWFFANDYGKSQDQSFSEFFKDSNTTILGISIEINRLALGNYTKGGTLKFRYHKMSYNTFENDILNNKAYVSYSEPRSYSVQSVTGIYGSDTNVIELDSSIISKMNEDLKKGVDIKGFAIYDYTSESNSAIYFAPKLNMTIK